MPADKDTTTGSGELDQPRPGHHPLAVVSVHTGPGKLLILGWPGLLDLQEQRIVVVAPVEQHQAPPHCQRRLPRSVGPASCGMKPSNRCPRSSSNESRHALQTALAGVDFRCVRFGACSLICCLPPTFSINELARFWTLVAKTPMRPSTITFSYQVSTRFAVLYLAIRARYAKACCDRPVRQGLFRAKSPASTTMLATRRDTSHSNGPGRVSSKSRRFKIPDVEGEVAFGHGGLGASHFAVSLQPQPLSTRSMQLLKPGAVQHFFTPCQP